MRKNILTIVLFAALSIGMASAQTTFSVMTLNVDGLPKKFAFFDINPDGPGSPGSERISEYIAAKGCDIVSMQECFNYRWEIWSRLFAAYEHDEWTGGVGLEEKEIDWRHPQNERFPCDGLNSAWRKDIRSTAYERVAHRQNFGKFSHAFDDMITKGFRRHEFTLADGTGLVVYNTHFDASDDTDEELGRDSLDRKTRLAQWRQLRDHVMAHLDARPVILTGDFNSFYARDSILEVFIQPIEATGRATVGDAWVERCNGGVYPTQGNATGETLDKIIYVNPVGGNTVTLLNATVDTSGYLYEGQPLGDHYPVMATFSVSSTTGITTAPVSKSATTGRAYTVDGQPATNATHGIVIENGQKKLQR